jgi:hypothetical protein
MSTPNTTPLTYNGYVTQIGTMAVVNTTTSSGVVVGVDTAFNNIIPQMLNYAELRIQRDLDLLPSLNAKTYTLSYGNNQLQISVNDFVTLQTIEVTGNDGSSYPIMPVSKEVIQNVYGISSTVAPPIYFAMYGGDASTGGDTYTNIIFGPYPDNNYTVTVTGTSRLPTLYQYANAGQAGTNTTFISTYLPDLLIMASMIYLSAFQRNFGRMSDDPAMAQSYEAQYKTLLTSAAVEEARKKFSASAWSSMSPAVAASPNR